MGAAASIETSPGKAGSFHPDNDQHRRSDVHHVVESFITERIENIARVDSLSNDRTDAHSGAEITVQPSIHSSMFSPLLGGIDLHSSSGALHGGKTSVSFILRRELNRRATNSSNSLNASQMSLRMIAMRNQSRREMRYEKVLNNDHPPPTMERIADYTEEINEEDEEDEGEELLGADDSFVKLGSRDAMPGPGKAVSPTGDSEAKATVIDTTVAQSPSAKGTSTEAVTPGSADEGTPGTAAAKSGVGLQFKRPPPLKLAIQDDADWIQVSDDEGEAALSPRKKPPSLSLTHTLIKAADQSYMFTQSGTIFVNGFKAGIGIEGIQSTNSRRFSKKLKLPMKDRLVLLSQLGHGASGVVYKAFDLVEMKIVALKMISVFEQGKRRQMVRELTALFDVFRQKKRDFRKQQEGGKLVAAMSQLALLSGFKYNKHMDQIGASFGTVATGNTLVAGLSATAVNSSNNRVNPGPNKAIVTGSTGSGGGVGGGIASGDMRQKRKTFTVLESVSEQPDDLDYLRSCSTPVIVSSTAAANEQLNNIIKNIEKSDAKSEMKEYKAEGKSSPEVVHTALLSSASSNISSTSCNSSNSNGDRDSKGQSSQKSPSKSEGYSSPTHTGVSTTGVSTEINSASNINTGVLPTIASPKKDSPLPGVNESKNGDLKGDRGSKEVIMGADDCIGTGTSTGTDTGVNVNTGTTSAGSDSRRRDSNSNSNGNSNGNSNCNSNGNGITSPRYKGTDTATSNNSNGNSNSNGAGAVVSSPSTSQGSPTKRSVAMSKQTSDSDANIDADIDIHGAGTGTIPESKAGPAAGESVFRSPNAEREPQSDSPRGTVGSKLSPLPPTATQRQAHAQMPTLGTGVQRFLGRPASDYIVDFHDAFSNIEDGGVALMMEYMDGGSLQDIVDDGGCADEITLANIAVQALIGLAFLHSCGQLHRDLKPGNFLISHRGEVKVADLGILVQLEKTTGRDESVFSGANSEVQSCKTSEHGTGIGTGSGQGSNNSSTQGMVGAALSSNGSGNNNTMEAAQALTQSQSPGNDVFEMKARAATESSVAVAVAPGKDDNTKRCISPFHVYKTASSPMPYTKTFVGTVTFMAPERIDGREYSYPSDVWAFGLSLLTVALGHLPIDTKGGYWTILHSVRDAEPPTLPDDGRFSEEFRDFISACLQKDPAKRLSCNELLFHPFLNKAVPEECGIDDGELDIDPVEAEAKGKMDLEAILVALHLHFERMKGNISTLDNMPTPRAGQVAVDQTTPTTGPSEYKKISNTAAGAGLSPVTGPGPGNGNSLVPGGAVKCHILHPYFEGLREARNTEAFLKDFVMHHPAHNLNGDDGDGDKDGGSTALGHGAYGGAHGPGPGPGPSKRNSTDDSLETRSEGSVSPMAPATIVSTPKRELSDLARKRLAALGYQLHLPVETLVGEAHKICVMIEKASEADPSCNDPNVLRIRMTSKVTRNSSPKAFQNRIRRDSK